MAGVPSAAESFPAPCPRCARVLCLEPRAIGGDASCPYCECRLFFVNLPGEAYYYPLEAMTADTRAKVLTFVRKWFYRGGTAAHWDIGNLDSLDVIDLIREVEQDFGVIITTKKALSWRSPGDLVHFLIRACEDGHAI